MYVCPPQRHTDSSLVHNAVPYNSTFEEIISVHFDPSHPKNTWSMETQTTNLVSDSSCQTDACTGTKRFHDKRSQTTKKLPDIKALRAKIRHLQSKLRKATCMKRKRMAESNLNAYLPPDAKDFFENQVNNLGRSIVARRYSATFYKNCFLIYHHSRSSYSFLRQIFFMPSPSGLRHQLQKIFQQVRIFYQKPHLCM